MAPSTLFVGHRALIKLTRPNGDPVWIKGEAVCVVMANQDEALVKQNKDKNMTQIGFNGPQSALLVKEKPHEVVDKIEALK